MTEKQKEAMTRRGYVIPTCDNCKFHFYVEIIIKCRNQDVVNMFGHFDLGYVCVDENFGCILGVI